MRFATYNNSSFFKERKLVFQKPGGGLEHVEKIAKETKPTEKRLSFEDAKKNFKTLDEHVKKIDKKYESMYVEPSEHLKKVMKRLKEVKDAFKGILDKKFEKTQEVIDAINNELQEIAKDLLVKVHKKKVEKEPEGGEEGPESGGETASETYEGKLVNLIKQIEEGEHKEMLSQKIELDELLDKLKPKENTDQSINLPGGYNITYVKWTGKQAKWRPEFVISKGTKILLISNNKKLNYPEHFDPFVVKVATIINGNAVMQNVMSKFNVDKLKFYSKENIKDFTSVLKNMVQNSGDEPWTKAFPNINASIHCKKINKNHAVFTVIMGKLKITYDTRTPNKIGYPNPNKGVKAPFWYDINKMQISDKDRQAVEKKAEDKKRERALKRKTLKEDKFNTERAGVAQTMIESHDKSVKEESRGNLNRLLTDKFPKKHIKFDKDPKTFMVDIDPKKDRRALRKLNSIRIHDLLKLQNLKDKVVRVKIGDREGMYYPGQQTCYEIDKKTGKQKPPQNKNRIKFGNREKIIVTVSTPNKTDFAQLNDRDRNDQKYISNKEMLFNILNFTEIRGKVHDLIKGFIDSKGKFKDLQELGKTKKYKELFKKLVKDGINENNYKNKEIWGRYLYRIKEQPKVVQQIGDMMKDAIKAIASYKSKVVKKAGTKKPAKSGTKKPSKLFS